VKTSRLLPPGRYEQGVSEPIRTRFFRLADCRLDFREFIRAKPHPDEFPQSLALTFLWSANFSSHVKIVSVTRKLFLHQDIFCVTDIQVLIETSLSLKKWLARLPARVNQPAAYLLVTGASQRESEMKADTIQVRSLAIEATGDFFRRKITPKIRLTGQWLERAGFKPGHRVEVLIEQPGSLTLRFLEQAEEVAL